MAVTMESCRVRAIRKLRARTRVGTRVWTRIRDRSRIREYSELNLDHGYNCMLWLQLRIMVRDMVTTAAAGTNSEYVEVTRTVKVAVACTVEVAVSRVAGEQRTRFKIVVSVS